MQPLDEQRFDLVRQAQQDVPRTDRPVLRRRLEHAFELVVVQGRDDRCGQNTRRHTGIGQRADHVQALLGARRSRFHAALQIVVERGEAHVDSHELVARELGQQIEIAKDQ